jgi:hypothetical protein
MVSKAGNGIEAFAAVAAVLFNNLKYSVRD